MHVETTARAWPFALTPATFRRLATAAAAMLFVIVSTGATVRLTSSGLGCRHWPGCQPGHPFPANGVHSYVEFGNRVVAGVTIVVTLMLAVGAFFARGLQRRTAWLCVAVFLGTAAQAPLGAIAVYLDLHPLIVMTHLLLSMLLLAAAVLVLLDAFRLERGSRPSSVPLEARRLALGIAAACFVLVLSGTFATAAGPHSGGEDVPRFGTLDVALVFHALSVAVVGLSVVFLLGYLAARRHEHPTAFRGTAALTLLLMAQMGLGELQYRTHLPWGLVLVHVAVAAAVWVGAVALASLFRAPVPT
jgi:cytochrome c oxidase assembly protein subunit 15